MLFMLRNYKHSISELLSKSNRFFSRFINVFEECLLVANSDTRCFSMWLFFHLMQFFSYNLSHKLVEIEYIRATVSTRLDPRFYVFYLCLSLHQGCKTWLLYYKWMIRFRLCWLHESKLVILFIRFYALCHAIIL